MKCKNCRYLSKETFENTILHTCNAKYYLIQRWNKTHKGHIYTTDALTSEDDICFFEQDLLNIK